MRMHQPGGSPIAEVDDWSWGKTRRRLGLLWRLTRPYRGRTALSVVSLLTATATALAPPYLAKYALDDAVQGRGGSRLFVVVAIFVAAGLANWGMTYVETYLTGWVGERIPRRPPAPPLRAPAAALTRLLRAQPRRRDHQPADERRRGDRPASHGTGP